MRRIILALSLVALLFGCGGGGGGGTGGGLPPLEPQTLALGLIPGNVGTTFTVTVVNRFGVTAAVTEPGHDPGFAAVPGQLPLDLAPGATADLQVVLTPWRAGVLTGDVAFELDTASAGDPQVTHVTAVAESVSGSITPASLEFGEVPQGDFADQTVHLVNTSTLSTLHLGLPVLPNADFSVVSPTLPTTVAPGAALDLQVRYAPPDVSAAAGYLLLPSDATNQSFSVLLAGSSSGQEVTDYGNVSFQGNGDTNEMQLDVPDDAISFMIQATTAPGTALGLRLLTGPGSKEYENETLTGPYIWAAQDQVFCQQVPNTDRTDVQLVPGGGTYTFKLLRWSGTASSCNVKAYVERRPRADMRSIATLDLNVFLAQAITPTAASASNDSVLQTVLGQVDTILSQQGIRVGDIDYYDIGNSAYDDVTEAEFGPMLQLSSAASETRLNLFFVRTAIGGGILGVSAALGGPVLNGTPVSGVMSLYSTNDPGFIGLVAAHEIGHYLGLAHTVEQTGEHDDIVDTVECPASGTSAACPTAGGGYLMHWQAVGGTDITDGEGLVVRGHPHMSPRLPSGLTLLAKPSALLPTDLGENPPTAWCGTCAHGHNVRVK